LFECGKINDNDFNEAYDELLIQEYNLDLEDFVDDHGIRSDDEKPCNSLIA
jgi:hypothetical protein